MFLKPDYDLKSIYEIDLEGLKKQGIKSLLFDLDSTLMGSKRGYYTEDTLSWLDSVKKDFFVGVVSNNNNPQYIEKVSACTDFPIAFEAHKPDIKVAKKFMEQYSLAPESTVLMLKETLL